MLGMQVGLSTMRARELAVSIFYRRHLALAVNLANGSATRSAREDTTTTLAANHMSRLLTLLKRALLHDRTTRRHNARLVHDTRHRPQDGSTPAAGRSGGNGLRVGHGLGRLRHAERVGRWV